MDLFVRQELLLHLSVICIMYLKSCFFCHGVILVPHFLYYFIFYQCFEVEELFFKKRFEYEQQKCVKYLQNYNPTE